MSSTNFNVGMFEEKNSSRVLKPPGGGHSDIFGIHGNKDETLTPSKRRNQPQSSISSCFFMEDEKKAVKITTDNNRNENGQQQNGCDENKAPLEENGNANVEKTGEQTIEKTETDQAPIPPRRVRVPPGGFSSGLW